MKHVSLDIHDFSVLNNKLDLLLEIKDRYPTFKVSMFTIPFDYTFEKSVQRIYRDMELKRIKENLDWIQIIPHGVTHMPREFENCDRHSMKMIIDNMHEIFDKDGIPFEKGFCAPFWLWNQEVVTVLNEYGWWGAIDRNQKDMICPKKFYKYNYSIDEEFWNSPDDVLKLHGHMDLPSANNLNDCLVNILKLPSDVEWHYVTDFLEERS